MRKNPEDDTLAIELWQAMNPEKATKFDNILGYTNEWNDLAEDIKVKYRNGVKAILARKGNTQSKEL